MLLDLDFGLFLYWEGGKDAGRCEEPNNVPDSCVRTVSDGVRWMNVFLLLFLLLMVGGYFGQRGRKWDKRRDVLRRAVLVRIWERTI